MRFSVILMAMICGLTASSSAVKASDECGQLKAALETAVADVRLQAVVEPFESADLVASLDAADRALAAVNARCVDKVGTGTVPAPISVDLSPGKRDGTTGPSPDDLMKRTMGTHLRAGLGNNNRSGRPPKSYENRVATLVGELRAAAEAEDVAAIRRIADAFE